MKYFWYLVAIIVGLWVTVNWVLPLAWGLIKLAAVVAVLGGGAYLVWRHNRQKSLGSGERRILP